MRLRRLINVLDSIPWRNIARFTRLRPRLSGRRTRPFHSNWGLKCPKAFGCYYSVRRSIAAARATATKILSIPVGTSQPTNISASNANSENLITPVSPESPTKATTYRRYCTLIRHHVLSVVSKAVDRSNNDVYWLKPAEFNSASQLPLLFDKTKSYGDDTMIIDSR